MIFKVNSLHDFTPLGFRQPEEIDEPLTQIARVRARRMLADGLVAEVDALCRFQRRAAGRWQQRIVRHGFGPECQLQTGISAVEV